VQTAALWTTHESARLGSQLVVPAVSPVCPKSNVEDQGISKSNGKADGMTSEIKRYSVHASSGEACRQLRSGIRFAFAFLFGRIVLDDARLIDADAGETPLIVPESESPGLSIAALERDTVNPQAVESALGQHLR
jgi:hypothetical protein